ncbi:MAG: alpha-amylase family glycosyl hydrolase [Bacteroidia bacterium]|nr:alpha-amylase family glycosyl hydrolase [Bacteroidia bacterium]
MKKHLTSLFLMCWASINWLAAQVTTNPVIFTSDQAVTITYDATQSAGQQLVNLPASVTTITAHVGAILVPNGTTWTNVPGTWGDPAAQPKFTRQGTSNIYTLTLPNGIRSMFPNLAAPNNTPIYRVGMVFRENGPCGGFNGVTTACREGKSAQGQDIFLEVNQGTYDIVLSANRTPNTFVNIGDNVTLNVVSNAASNLSIRVNGATVASQTNVTSLSHTYTFAAGATTFKIEAVGVQGSNTVVKSISYVVPLTPSVQAVPSGLRDGINYDPNDASRVTLVFTAPEKRAVYVIGDFNNWQLDNAFLMRRTPGYGGSGPNSNPDVNKFWIEITGLTPGVQYGFQYWVYDASNNLVRTTDPYCELILDQFDSFIPATTYPNLKPYPTGQQGAVGILEPGKQPYQWSQATLNFQKPDKRRLTIYEAWVHDFDVNRNFQNLIDRLDYLQNLGINALQLMPIMEFNGNISWGYNPTFFCAVDKAYGTREKLKELIDKCHQRGIAVILDIALNHAEFEFPGCKMYWNASLNRPAANNPYFNEVATHPFSVFQDFNHESMYTRNFTKRVVEYWIQEYKIDGYRYDLAKGLTQTNTGSNVNAWNQYDASRVVIIKRIADWQWAADPRSYVILEFLATGGTEEAEYAAYRLNDPVLGGTGQGGMMLWRNMETNYAQNIMGFNTNHYLGDADFANNPFGTGTPFTAPRVLSYMESHDEERVMYKALQFGNQSNPGHNVRDLNVALKRVEPAILFHTPIVGPKMIWQFGELGYDFSINRCSNGTNNSSCRTDPKPLPWVAPQNYHQVAARMDLYRFYSIVNQLKLKYDAFMTNDVYIREDGGLTKMLKITPQPYNPNPSTPNLSNIVIIANFDVVPRTVNAEFHVTGTWYSYFQNNAVFNATSTNQPINLDPGEYRMFTQQPMVNLEANLTGSLSGLTGSIQNVVNIALSWTNTVPNNIGLRVRRRLSPSGTFQTIATLPAGATSFVDSGLQELTAYDYQIEAYNFGTNTLQSNIFTISTGAFPPAAPTNLVLTNLTTNTASFQWTDNSSDETGFILERKIGASGTYADIGSVTAPNVTTAQDNTITANNTYIYRVGAVKGSVRVYSNEVTVSTMPPSAAPTSLVATANAFNSISLTWVDNANNETGFRVLRATNSGGPFNVIATLPQNTTSYTDLGLTENTQYFYRVEVFNLFGTLQSNTADATTPLAPLVAPSNLTIANQEYDGITRVYTVSLLWIDNSNNETSFLVQRSLDANTGFTTLATLAPNTVSYNDNTITDLTKEYFYRVVVTRGAQQAISNVVSTGQITALERQTLAKFISLSPNPAEENLDVKIDNAIAIVKANVFDMQGKLVDSFPIDRSNYHVSYPVKHLVQGQYTIQFITNQGQEIAKRFIKK